MMSRNIFSAITKSILFCAILIAILVVLAYTFCSYFLPIPEKIRFSSSETTRIYDRNHILLYEILLDESGKKNLLSINDLPKNVINAFLAAEDKNFYHHGGIDPMGTIRALWQNYQANEIVSGGSSITQQLARNILGTEKERSLKNKIIESAYSIRFEHVYDKREILEKYLNSIYFGNLSYGLESAARDYFGKHVSQLDLAETALLAGIPKAPSYYNPFHNLDGAKKRQKYVLEQMVKENFITAEEADLAFNEKLEFRVNKYEIRAPHFVHFVIDELEKKYGADAVHTAGWSVTTTLDINKQEAIEKIIQQKLEYLQNMNVSNGAVLAVDLSTNSILAYVGSQNYFNKSIDGAIDMIQALRQPGSALKPFTYLLALINGQTLATIYNDIHTQFPTAEGPYTPKNYDLQYHGAVSVRKALANSYNIPAVKALNTVGVSSFIGFLNSLGINSLDAGASHYGLAITLGGAEVKMFELAGAYNVLARQGDLLEFEYLENITDSRGKVIFKRNEREGKNILGVSGKQYAFLINSVLSDNAARLPAFGFANMLELSHPAVAKTGTTRNFKDNWTFGFSPQILTAVWVGNADASPMRNISGIDGAGPIWNETMEFLHRNLPVQNFVRPDGLINKEICAESGLLSTENCPNTVSEYFIRGTEPQKKDNIFEKKKVIMHNDGQWRNWLEGCEGEVKEKVFANYPAELKQWAFESGITQPPTEDCRGLKAAAVFSGNYPNMDINDNSSSDQIANPTNGDSYFLDTIIPDNFETIPLRINLVNNPEKVCYTIDNENVGCASEMPFEYLWMPTRGQHSLFARIFLSSEKYVQTDKVQFTVK